MLIGRVVREEIYLHPGQLRAVRDPVLLGTLVGSCVAVCLYAPGEGGDCAALRVGENGQWVAAHPGGGAAHIVSVVGGDDRVDEVLLTLRHARAEVVVFRGG